MTNQLKPGDRVFIIGPKHPWHGNAGNLIVFEPYGPKELGWSGWKVRMDNGMECYAQAEDLFGGKPRIDSIRSFKRRVRTAKP